LGASPSGVWVGALVEISLVHFQPQSLSAGESMKMPPTESDADDNFTESKLPLIGPEKW